MKRHRFFPPAIWMTVLFCITESHAMTDVTVPPEPADISVFTLTVPDTPRGRLYMAAYDEGVAGLLEEFDADSGFIPQVIPPGYTEAPAEVAGWNRHRRKGLLSGDTHWLYRMGRKSASAIGAMALAYAQPLSRYHNDPDVLRAVKNGFEFFIRNQSEEGEFVFSPLRYSSVYGTHEMAWRLEDFIYGYFAVRDALTADERSRYWLFLNKAMRFLQATPCHHACNRGMVWAGVMAVCWRATGEESYLNDARRVWERIRASIFQNNGQIYEGEGPDLVYSPVSYEYLLRYRFMTGDTTLDETIFRATDWMGEMYTNRFAPFVGLSTRYDTRGNEMKVYCLLAGYEMFMEQHPEYADLSENLLNEVIRQLPEAGVSHGGITWMTAAHLHNPEVARRGYGTTREPWFRRYSQTSIHYYTVGQQSYQTMAVLMSVRSKKGVQVWSVNGSDPFLFAEDGRESTVRAWGLDLRSRDVTRDDWYRRESSADGGAGVSTLVAGHGPLAAGYIFTPGATIILHRMNEPQDRETVWSGSGHYINGYRLHEDRVTADGADGALHWWGSSPTLSADSLQIVFRDTAAVQVYGLASGYFSAGQMAVHGSIVQLSWIDDSGLYDAYLNMSSSTAEARVGNTALRLGRGQARVIRPEAD